MIFVTSIAIHLPKSMLPYITPSYCSLSLPANSGVEVALYYKLVGGRRVSYLSVQVCIRFSLIFSLHVFVHAYDGDEAFAADVKAKLHKPFIYVAGGRLGIYFWSLNRAANPTPCILSS